MSLLIKALDKAEAEKAKAKGDAAKQKAVKSKPEKPSKSKSEKPTQTLSLEEVDKSTPKKAKESQVDELPKALKDSAANVSKQDDLAPKVASVEPKIPESKVNQGSSTSNTAQAQAANIFTAKHEEPQNHSAKLALLIGLIALGLMGVLAYWYQTVVNVPDIVIPPRVVVNPEMPEPLPELVLMNDEAIQSEPEMPEAPEMTESEVVATLTEPVIAAELEDDSTVNVAPSDVFAELEDASQTEKASPSSLKVGEPSLSGLMPAVEETLTTNEAVVDERATMMPADEVLPDVGIASESASIKVTPQKTTSGVSPILMRAYEAYNAGDNHRAQQGYQQVLKRYGPNVDAMLGLGAIASRQGRMADANSWYRKVLEIEPRSEVAKAGLLSLQQDRQPQSGESNIKSMLATAPNDANLHAALGDLYAKQQQWSLAQQAYFDAYRFNASAENAFNLGVSLDQLGKPKLALPYYQEALQKAAQSKAINVEALVARISSIE